VKKFTVEVNTIELIERSAKYRYDTMSSIAINDFVNNIIGASNIGIIITCKSVLVMPNSVSIVQTTTLFGEF
jgi:hypothetical protein